MFFKLPTTVYFQENCIKSHQEELKAFGNKALIVMGRHSSYNNGSFADLKDALHNQNLTFEVFDEVEENPSAETIQKAYEINKDKNIDFVIGVGGGSAIDAAKAIAVMLYYKFDSAYKLFEKAIANKSLPVVAVATTCGTGSEVTAASILTDNKRKTKASISYRIFPTLSLCDSKYLRTLSFKTLKYTALDALGHLIESYISSKATRFSDMITKEGLRVWNLNEQVLKGSAVIENKDYDNLLLASTYGGMAIAHCGTNIPHGLSYTLTYNENIPHGKAVGYFLYGLMKYADKNRVDEILKLLNFDNLKEFKDYLVETFQLERLDDEILNKAIAELLPNKNKLSYCPYDVDEKILREVAYSLWTD